LPLADSLQIGLAIRRWRRCGGTSGQDSTYGAEEQAHRDRVYVIVSHAEQPTTYKAVLVWRERNLDREAPDGRHHRR
jgi:hypothetical protein